LVHSQRGLPFRFTGRFHHAILGRNFRRVLALLLIPLAIAGSGSSAQPPDIGPIGDYGDAPDGLSASYTHVDPQKIGLFPSTYKASSDHRSYIVHRFPQERVYLGPTVTTETNALLVDRDVDDGWLPGSFPTCSQANLLVSVTVPQEATAGPIYLNVLFDWNHDGRWSDFSICSSPRGIELAEEWAIRNLPLHQPPYSLAPGFVGTVVLPEITTGPLPGELWIRFTISTEPVDEVRYIPATLGGHGWNGEGDFLYGETEDYFSCLLSDQSLSGCPEPLASQPPIDPPPTTSTNRSPVIEDDVAVLCTGAQAVIAMLANDTDPDNESLTVVEVTQPGNGTVILHTDGTVTYVPYVGFSGVDDFTYIACDVGGLCDDATVTVSVNPGPDASDDNGITDQNTPITLNVLANDTASISAIDPATLTIVSGPSHGTAVVNPNGSITYAPSPNFSGTDSFTYTIGDEQGCGSNTATVIFTVNSVTPTNQGPIAADDTVSTPEDTPLTISVLTNDSDPDGDPLTITGNTQPTNGSVSCTATQCTYTPNANFHGTDSFTYTISDGNGGTDTATVTITVNPVNDPPQLTAIPDQSVSETQTLTVNVSCTDVDGDTLTLTASNLPPGATFTDNGNGTGTLSYSPDFDTVLHPATSTLFSNVQITCSDGHGGSDTDSFNITVNDVNRAPQLTILGDQTLNEGDSLSLTDFATCTDPDGDSVSLSASGLPGFAGFTDSHDGTGNLSLNPSLSDSGSYTGNSITCTDPFGATDTETFNITVNNVNQPPVAEANGPYSCNLGDTVTLSSAGSTDPDGTIVLYEWDLDNNGSFETTGASPTFSCTTQGTFTVTLKVTDNDGLTDTDTATVTVNDAAPCDADPVKDTSLQVQWGAPSVSGNTATIVLSVTNTGSDDYALNLTLDILIVESKTTAPGAVVSPPTWSVGNLAPGATAQLTVTVTVSGSGKVQLQAIVTNEDCRPQHTQGKQDKVDIMFK
jgi:hypothetical protein